MQGTLVRLFVVVSGLLFPKEHAPVLEHDDTIITGMRRHEGLLQRERANLERELAKAAMPKDRPEGLDTHSVLQAGDQDLERIDITETHQTEQELRESSMKENHSAETQTEMDMSKQPGTEYPLTEDDVVHLDEDKEPSDISEEFPSEQEHSQSFSSEELDQDTRNEKLAEDKIDAPNTILLENIIIHEVEEKTQQSLSDVSDPEVSSNEFEDESVPLYDEKSSHREKHLDIDSGMELLTKPKQRPPSTESNYMWYLCNAYSLFVLVRFLFRHLRGTSPDQELPEASHEDLQATPAISAEISVPDQETLMGFYDRYVHVPAHESQRVCAFVEGFVDDLLAAIREAGSGDDQAHLEVEDFLEVGSLYEACCMGKTLTCDLWVPVSPRKPYSFQVHLSTNQDGDADGGSYVRANGKVKVLKGGRGTANGCPCSQAGEDGDMLCLLHTHDNKEENRDKVTDAIDGPLCGENTPYLSRTEVARWFRSAARQAWEEMSHKYELELNFWSRESPGAWHVRFRSGRTIHFNVMPVVKLEETEVCLVSCLDPKKRKESKNNVVVTLEAQEQWPLSFARYERNLLRLLGKRLPPNACHLPCLQILSYLNQKQVWLTGESGLSSHHLKTIMLHMLLDKALPSSEWESECLADRLRDSLDRLKRSLQTRWLSHALVGNPLIPEELGLPANVCQSEPINVLHPLLNQGRLYARTVQHFEEMLRNMPVLIQEYMQVQKKVD